MMVSPKTMAKIRTLEGVYRELIFQPVGQIPVRMWETETHERAVPGDERAWKAAPAGTKWGKAWGTAWFKGRVPAEQAGQELFVRATGFGPEAMVWIDGTPRGILNHPAFEGVRGPHHAVRLTAKGEEAGRAEGGYEVAFEAYAGHPVVGCQPYDTSDPSYPATFEHTFGGAELLIRRDDVLAFVFDLMALNKLSDALPAESSRKGAIDAGLQEVWRVIHPRPDEVEENVWRPRLAEARTIMRPLLEARNGSTAARAGLIGHSHMDTAWLWPIDETIRKCARTYANALSIMEQYPEYTFVQSSMVHAEFMRVHYPQVFEGMRQRVAEGRWEPIGGAWVEPDCNLASGEALVRHFLRGHAFTKEHFAGYRSDVFWLPDTFGYSAALPQILLGCGIRFFLTTKLSWNDTNRFPYDTFVWEGIDGSEVLTQFNIIHCWPDPKTLIDNVEGGQNPLFGLKHKDVTRERMISYGHGDGGGGPPYAMPEIARRVKDLEGCPKAEHTTVTRFMHELEKHALPHFSGELYLEGHRGTLTQQHTIKRNNRFLELALRDLELASVLAGAAGRAKRGDIRGLWDVLLINQFHDIVPGTSIPEVNDRAAAETQKAIDAARAMAKSLAGAGSPAGAEGQAVTVVNSLSWARGGEIAVAGVAEEMVAAEGVSQRVQSVTGEKLLVLSGVECTPLAGTTVRLAKSGAAKGPGAVPSPFKWDGKTLQTPHATVRFDAAGGMESFFDKASGRELRGKGHALNTFLLAEDVPGSWDNWDVDADLELKAKPVTQLVSSQVVADGPLQFRLRQTYRLGRASTLEQDIVFHRDTPRVDFETVLDWKEKHHFLKTGFEFNLLAPSARFEIQFGHLERSTHRNFPTDRARFEVAQHKWCDLSENRFGVALLNDCKYGISVLGSDLRLSLHKGGTHPDPRGDEGRHVFTYAMLPHAGSFTAESVVRPAYELNVRPMALPGAAAKAGQPLLTVDAPNVIVEAIKWAEEGDAMIVRLYECERSACRATLSFGRAVKKVEETNMLEEPQRELKMQAAAVELAFRAFEVKTLRVTM